MQQVRAALDQTFGGQNVVVQTYGDPSQRQIMVRVPEVGAESGTSLSSGAEKVQAGAAGGQPRQRDDHLDRSRRPGGRAGN